MSVEDFLPNVVRRSVVRKYGLFVLAVLVLTGSVTALIVIGVGDSVRDNRQTELRATAEEEADRLASYYRDQVDRAGLVSENGDFEGPTTTREIRDSLDNQRENFENRELVALHYVIESNRTIRASTLPSREGESIGAIPWQGGFEFIDPNDAIVSNTYEAPQGSVNYISFASPVEGKDGVLVVVLNATARGQSFRDTVDGGYTQVVDDRGEIQFANQPNQTLSTYDAGGDAVPVQQGLAGTTGITSDDGDSEVIAYSSVPGRDLVVVKHAPKTNAYALSNAVTEQLLGLVAIIALAFVLLIGVVYRDLVVPMTRVTQQARALAAGDIDAHPKDGNRIDEIGQLRDGVRDTTEYLVTVTEQAEAIARQEFEDDAFEDSVPGSLGTALEDMKRDLEQAIAQLERTVERLEKSNERLQQFAYVASHDLQEPARMVSSYVSLLDAEYGDELDEEAQEYMDFAVDGADRMQDMIDALLDYARIQTEAEEFTAVDAGTVLSETVTDLGLLIDERDATVTHDDLPAVHADRAQLGQVFQNLVENAIQHGGKEIHVGAEQSDDEVVFAVSDDGDGIPERQQDKIFEIFEQGSRDDEGTGIGLAVCDRIVSRHGGQMWVESAEGEGTTFYFSIPA